MTADELAGLPNDNLRHELVFGELKTMTPSHSDHGGIAGTILTVLGTHVRANKLGRTFAADGGFLISTDPDTVLAPDASFVKQERIPASGLPQSFFPGAPDLVVEVVSGSDRPRDIREKTDLWLNGGAAIVWVVYPKLRVVEVYRPGVDSIRLGENNILYGDDVVPGFSCLVRELFE